MDGGYCSIKCTSSAVGVPCPEEFPVNTGQVADAYCCRIADASDLSGSLGFDLTSFVAALGASIAAVYGFVKGVSVFLVASDSSVSTLDESQDALKYLRSAHEQAQQRVLLKMNNNVVAAEAKMAKINSKLGKEM
jgi:hypothetical protein